MKYELIYPVILQLSSQKQDAPEYLLGIGCKKKQNGVIALALTLTLFSYKEMISFAATSWCIVERDYPRFLIMAKSIFEISSAFK